MITANQRDSVVKLLAKQLQAIDDYRDQIEIDRNDLGTTFEMNRGFQPSLDDLLKPWRTDPVGRGLRQGIREVGKMIAPHVTQDELLGICGDACAQSQNSDWSHAIFNQMWDGLKTSDGRTWMA